MNVKIDELEQMFEEYKKHYRKAQIWDWVSVVVSCFAITFIGFTGVRMFLKEQYWAVAIECVLFWFNVLLLLQSVIRMGRQQTEYHSMEMKHRIAIKMLETRGSEEENKNV